LNVAAPLERPSTTSTQISDQDFEFVRTLVRQRSAISLEANKAYLAEARLSSLAKREKIPSLKVLVEQLRREAYGPLHRKVVEAMTTNETSFFRDMHPFEALRKVILPELIQRRGAEKTLRIWCAACSSGQEPYTIALLMREHLPELRTWKVQILATDLSTEILDRARQGRFSQLEVNRGLPASALVRHFTKVGLDWQASEDLKGLIEFRQMNLAESWPSLPPMDVVFLRNVLIYFDVAVKKDILTRTRRVLRPDGTLFLGAAETTTNLDDLWERVLVDKASCYRVRSSKGSSHG
jgi:chemotaxis protein methyltransferase CheR